MTLIFIGTVKTWMPITKLVMVSIMDSVTLGTCDQSYYF